MSRLVFKKHQHLVSRQEFLDCYDKGQRFFSKNFVVFVYNRNKQPEIWRLGLAVGRKIGSAVQRNRVKRVLRELFRLHQHDIPSGLDYVVVPKKHINVSALTLEIVKSELLAVLCSGKLKRLAS